MVKMFKKNKTEIKETLKAHLSQVDGVTCLHYFNKEELFYSEQVKLVANCIDKDASTTNKSCLLIVDCY